MGTIIDPTAIRAQSDGIVRALTAQNSTLKNVLPSISNFQNEPELGGAAWSGLKSHIGGHRSVIQGLICANEDVMSDSEELITASGSEKLDEDKIRAEIEKLRSQSQRYYSNYIHYSDLLRQPAIAVMPTLMPYYRRMMWHYMSLRTKSNQAIIKLEKKLAKIAKIVSATLSLYTTSEALYGNVETGLQQLDKSGSGGGFTGVAGGTWQTNLDKRWETREEVNAEKYLIEQDISKEELAHMKKLGYEAVEFKSIWVNSSSTEQNCLRDMMKGNYAKAFNTSPLSLSDGFYVVLADYSERLFTFEESNGQGFPQFESFVNGILVQTPLVKKADRYNKESYTLPSTRSAHLEKLYGAMTIKMEGSGIALSLIGGDQAEFDDLYMKHKRNMSVANVFSSLYCIVNEPEGVFSNYKMITDKMPLNIKGLTFDGSIVDFNIGYSYQQMGGNLSSTKEPTYKTIDEYVPISLGLLFESASLDRVMFNESMQKLENSSKIMRDGLLANFVKNTALAGLALAAPEVVLVIKFAMMVGDIAGGEKSYQNVGLDSALDKLYKASVGPLGRHELDGAKIELSKGTKLGLKAAEDAISSLWKYNKAIEGLDKAKLKELEKEQMKYFGTAGYRQIADGAQLHSFSGVFDPKAFECINTINNQGLIAIVPEFKKVLSDKKIFNSFVNSFPEEQRKGIETLLTGGYDLSTDLGSFTDFYGKVESLEAKFGEFYRKNSKGDSLSEREIDRLGEIHIQNDIQNYQSN